MVLQFKPATNINLDTIGAESARRKKSRIACFCVGMTLPFIVFAGKDSFSNSFKFALLVTSSLSFGATIVLIDQNEIADKIADQDQIAARQRYAAYLNGLQEISLFRSEIITANEKLSLIASLPIEQQLAWINRSGLGDMIQSLQGSAIDAQAEPLEDDGLEAIAPSSVRVFHDDGGIDTSWLTPEFANESKVLVSERGGGKTNVLKWLVSAIPEEQLILIDPHLLANQFNNDGKAVWLNCSADEEQKLIPHTSNEIRSVLNRVKAEGKARIQGRGKVSGPIHIVLDEGDSDEIKGRDGCLGELVEFLEQAASEFRKVNINVTLVLHTLKKNQTGLDASILSQFSWLIMGGFGASSDVVWPGDFDPKYWSAQREQANSLLDQSKARACILRRRGDGRSDISVVAMPKIVLGEAIPKHQTQSEPQLETTVPAVADAPLGQQLREKVGDRATMGQIYQAIIELTGTSPTQAAVLYMLNVSGIELLPDAPETDV